MANIEYYGLSPQAVEFVNSEEFRAILADNPNLRLVQEVGGISRCINAILPLSEGVTYYIAILDTDNNDNFMWVLYDDEALVEDPSESLIKVLRLMDAYSVKTGGERLFIPLNEDLEPDDITTLTAEFNFTTGKYKF